MTKERGEDQDLAAKYQVDEADRRSTKLRGKGSQGMHGHTMPSVPFLSF